jgi:hypothetical protein
MTTYIENTDGTPATHDPRRARFTIASEPPQRRLHQKRGRWETLLDECRRAPGEWRRIIDPMRRSTAAQIASDIRNAHRREASKFRVRGLLPTDRFDAVWGSDPTDADPEHVYVWLCYLGDTRTPRNSDQDGVGGS